MLLFAQRHEQVQQLQLSLPQLNLNQIQHFQPEVIVAEHPSENTFVLQQAEQHWAAYGLYCPNTSTLSSAWLEKPFAKIVLLPPHDPNIAAFQAHGLVLFDVEQYFAETEKLLYHGAF